MTVDIETIANTLIDFSPKTEICINDFSEKANVAWIQLPNMMFHGLCSVKTRRSLQKLFQVILINYVPFFEEWTSLDLCFHCQQQQQQQQSTICVGSNLLCEFSKEIFAPLPSNSNLLFSKKSLTHFEIHASDIVSQPQEYLSMLEHEVNQMMMINFEQIATNMLKRCYIRSQRCQQKQDTHSNLQSVRIIKPFVIIWDFQSILANNQDLTKRITSLMDRSISKVSFILESRSTSMSPILMSRVQKVRIPCTASHISIPSPTINEYSLTIGAIATILIRISLDRKSETVKMCDVRRKIHAILASNIRAQQIMDDIIGETLRLLSSQQHHNVECESLLYRRILDVGAQSSTELSCSKYPTIQIEHVCVQIAYMVSSLCQCNKKQKK